MKHMSALQLRQSLGAAVADLERTGEPIILEKGRRPVGAVVSLVDFRMFFSQKAEEIEQQALQRDLDSLIRASSNQRSAEALTRELRDSKC